MCSHEEVSAHALDTRVGVLVMAHGTPDRPEAIAEFYTRIRRGRPPSDTQLAELQMRYEAIGGTSPLTARTEAQVAGLRRLLEARAPGRYLVALGSKHVEPSVEVAATALADAGVGSVIGMVLTPHPSSMGSGEYLARAADTLAGHPAAPRFIAIDGWYQNPAFVAAQARLLAATMAEAQRASGRIAVLFTAHSLPQRVVAEGDRYPEHLASSAGLIASAAGVEEWSVAWQSAGRTPEPWLGPDLLEVIRSLPSAGADTLVVCPVGFVADHLEVLYDLDIEARHLADEVGVRFWRTPSLNDDPRFLTGLADLVIEAEQAHAPRGLSR